MSRPTLWSTADLDEDLADAVDAELSLYAQQGQNPAIYDQLGAQIEQLEPLLAIQQHMAALAAVPDVVKSFIVSFHQAILKRDLPSITIFYTTTFPKLTDRFYSRTEWPEPETIAPLLSSNEATEDQIHIFLVLYRDLYYRHVYSRLHPNIDDRFHSYENSCELFNYLLNSPSSADDQSDEPAPVDLVLPEQWLWDIIDEFIYQFQVFCSWRSKVKSKTDDELMMLADGTGVWSSYSVLNVLYSLIQKSKINEFIVALKEEQEQGREGARSAEEVAKSISPYTALPLYRTLGYFSVLGLLRVHVLLGDFTLALKVMDQVGEFLLGGSGFGAKANKSSFTALPTLPATHISTHYYVGFCYMMLRRYPDAIRTFVTVLNFFQRMQRMRNYSGYERKDQYDQIAKTADRTLALYAMCHSLVLPGSPFTRLDDNITSTAKERYGDQMGRMSKGGSDALAAFEELFLYACPKFINANSPPYDDPDAIALLLTADQPESGEGSPIPTEPTQRHLRLFLASAGAQSPLSTLRSFLHLYTSLTTEKLSSFLDLVKVSESDQEAVEEAEEEAVEEAEEEAIQEMMVLKQNSRSLSRIAQGRSEKGNDASPAGLTVIGTLLEGEMISTSDLNFVIDDNTIHIAESTVGRRYAGWFIKNTERSQRVLDEIRGSPLPVFKGKVGQKQGAPGTVAPGAESVAINDSAEATQKKAPTKTVAWGGAGTRTTLDA
ncbi:RNA polymerase I-associated factor PAF67-domain-containing protein [Lentinula boryana]|uniref:Eukaryotic translation initiation factor 3 subunit L n=1 Tax=Lentinula boryana TaxID=40481 RepID=A0ABQ8QF42_9AGAR|nr:RNA polymerase I-associated factor PAF67-domain-containing protein [Lentinula boryana]